MTDQDLSVSDPETPSMDTFPLMTWGAIQFVQRPSSKILRGVVMCVASMILLAIASTFFIHIDLFTTAYGEVVSDPALVQVYSPMNGLVSGLTHKPGDHVTKGELLGYFPMDSGGTQSGQSYLKRHRILAPIDGTLEAVHAPLDGPVSAGSIFALISPVGAQDVAWIEVRSTDLPNIHPGQRVVHVLPAFPFQRFGTFDGNVLSVERVAANPNSGETLKYYVRASIRPPKNVHLALSMQVQSRIVTDRKTLKDLLLEKCFGWFS